MYDVGEPSGSISFTNRPTPSADKLAAWPIGSVTDDNTPALYAKWIVLLLGSVTDVGWPAPLYVNVVVWLRGSVTPVMLPLASRT